MALDLTVTPDLRREGLARELVNRIQNQRKDLGLELDDRIRVDIQAAEGELTEALRAHWETIAGEVLATHGCPDPTSPAEGTSQGPMEGGAEGGVVHEIEGAEVRISIVPDA